MKTIIFRIGGMECPNCAMLIESIENKRSGITRVEASYRKSQVSVEFDDEVVSEEIIKNKITDLGYQVLSHVEE
jgi:copper chaperone CopZ